MKVSRRSDWLILAAIGAVTLSVYLLTVCPTVYEGDSGEIISSIANLGVAHPTGFPLYMLVGKIAASVLLLGEIAFRVNLLSVILATVTVCLFYFVLRSVGLGCAAAVGGALFLAFSATFWSHATAARVYPIATFFIVLMLLMMVRWSEGRGDMAILGFGVALGLGLGTHITVILLVPMALAILALEKVPWRTWWLTAKAGGLVLILGASQYLYVPVRASQRPGFNWGDPVGIGAFLSYITQREYSFKMASRTLEQSVVVGQEIGRLALAEFTWLGIILVAVGLYVGWWERRRLLLASLLVPIGNVALMISYGNPADLFTLYRYLFPSYPILALWLAHGLEGLRRLCCQRAGPRWQPVAAAVTVLLPVVALAVHYGEHDRSRNYIVRDYAQNLLDTVPSGGMLITTGDAVSGGVWYLRTVPGTRPDVIHLERNLMSHDWYCRQMRERVGGIIPADILDIPPEERLFHTIDANLGRLPILSVSVFLDRYENVPHGLLARLEPKGQVPDLAATRELNRSLWGSYETRGLLDEGIHKETMVAEIVRLYSKSHNNFGYYLYQQGDLEEAAREYELSLLHNPESVASLVMLSQIRLQEGRIEEANELLGRAQRLDPPSSLAVHLQRGIRLGSRGQHEEAIEEFELALQADSTYLPAYLNLGAASMRLNRSEDALRYYEQAIRLDPGPKCSAAYLNLGLIHANVMRDYARARTYFEKYLEYNPGGEKSEAVRQALQTIVGLPHGDQD